MIAVDTNVLLRYLLNDDPKQSKKAEALICGTEAVLLTDIVLVEMLWTLRGKKYQLTKKQLADSVLALFSEPNIHFEDAQAVWQALSDFSKAKPVGKKDADFPDALVINKAKSVIKSKGEPFSGSYTFDKAAQKLPGAKVPE